MTNNNPNHKVYQNIQPTTSKDRLNQGRVLFQHNDSIGVYVPEVTYKPTRGIFDNFEYIKEGSAGTVSVYGGLSMTDSNSLGQLLGTINRKFNLENGPYSLSTDGDKVEIHNKKVNQSPIATYTYAGGSGEFLSLEVKVDDKKANDEATQSSTVDPKTKAIDVVTTQAVTDPTPYSWEKFEENNKGMYFLPDTIGSWHGDPYAEHAYQYARRRDLFHYENIWNSRKLSKKEEEALPSLRDIEAQLSNEYEPTIDDLLEIYGGVAKEFEKTLSDVESKQTTPYALLKPVDFPNLVKTAKVKTRDVEYVYNALEATEKDLVSPNTYDGPHPSRIRERQIEAMKKADPSIIEIRELTPSDPEYKKYEGEFKRPVVIIRNGSTKIELNGQKIYANADPSMLKAMSAKSAAINAKSKELTGTLKVVGNPALIRSRVIELKNLSSFYSGNWYIKKARHVINSSNAYVTECDIVRTSTPMVVGQTVATVNTMKYAQKLQGLVKFRLDNKVDEINSGLKKSVNAYMKVRPNDGKPRDIAPYHEPGMGVAFPTEQGGAVVMKNDKMDFVPLRRPKDVNSPEK